MRLAATPPESRICLTSFCRAASIVSPPAHRRRLFENWLPGRQHYPYRFSFLTQLLKICFYTTETEVGGLYQEWGRSYRGCHFQLLCLWLSSDIQSQYAAALSKASPAASSRVLPSRVYSRALIRTRSLCPLIQSGIAAGIPARFLPASWHIWASV